MLLFEGTSLEKATEVVHSWLFKIEFLLKLPCYYLDKLTVIKACKY